MADVNRYAMLPLHLQCHIAQKRENTPLLDRCFQPNKTEDWMSLSYEILHVQLHVWHCLSLIYSRMLTDNLILMQIL